MEDKGDKGARKGGKHNLNFEDHVVWFGFGFLLSFCQTAKNIFSAVVV